MVSTVTSDRMAEIRERAAAAPPARERNLAARIGLPEAALIAAHAEGDGPWRSVPIAAAPDRLMPVVQGLGEVMALTRNEHCVIEKVGIYEGWQGGDHAGMILGPEIDLRVFPKHWAHAWAVEKDGEDDLRRSLQIFDAAGDAVHKVFLREGSDVRVWDAASKALCAEGGLPDFAPRVPTEGPKIDPAKAGRLRDGWRRMTDAHQFLILVRRMKLNRLGAYRIAGPPFARRLCPGAVVAALEGLAGSRLPVMVFVGNAGCIEIHTGPLDRVAPTGPWINVLEPRHNLHLRADKVAEVWAVEKPTGRGPALSVEAFGVRKEEVDHHEPWAELVAGLPAPEETPL
ncbi:putative hemin transport protein [Hasllibacter halocynthiae]|uniref:Putative hemin transport protein n=1 Tax=Hasllibacter halocynthiae TaxID=595589 RepID=A0A2T0X9W9_9RHOB|nr:ChuX/HutX family heme-like substrate-binding protein [Hasllibacter halocynthiae]PRY95726.1 putative hemin transport protein [Hasllibacter halocynthiae]